MEIPAQKKLLLVILGGIQVLLIIVIVLYVKTFSPELNIVISSEQVTSEADLYSKLEGMCKSNNGKYYNSCSRSPLCGTEKDGWDEDRKVRAYEELVSEEGSTKDSPQSCMGDGAGRSKGCGGEYVPLCCYAMAFTGDPLKCAGYWERLWCPTDLCNKIDSSKDDACGGGKCQCGHAWSEYCKAGGQTPGKPTISLCERLKKEGITGIVCTSEVSPVTPTPIAVQNTKPSCSSMNFVDSSNGIIPPEQRINDQQVVNISVVGMDIDIKPLKIDICWALAGQTKEFYISAANWACEPDTTMQTGTNPKTLIAELKNKNMLYFMQKLPNLSQNQIKDYGLVITTRIYGGNNANLLCSTNPGYNNGSGVMVDLTKQDPAQKFVNSTCGLGSVANVVGKSCALKLNYDTNGGGNTSYDLNGDGKLDISDFTEFVRYYKTKNNFVDFNGDGKVGIEDFSYFRNEYVRVQGSKS